MSSLFLNCQHCVSIQYQFLEDGYIPWMGYNRPGQVCCFEYMNKYNTNGNLKLNNFNYVSGFIQHCNDSQQMSQCPCECSSHLLTSLPWWMEAILRAKQGQNPILQCILNALCAQSVLAGNKNGWIRIYMCVFGMKSSKANTSHLQLIHSP